MESIMNTEINSCKKTHKCNCGGKSGEHLISDGGCHRFMTTTPIKSINMPDMWDVDGHSITDYTLRYQRGYSQHGCDCWSTWGGSVNSLEGDW
jgi:hypothetical protein